MTGLIKVIKVHTAAVPIQPAPIKRTLEAQMEWANSEAAWPASGVITLVRYGTNTPQERRVPTKMAMPLAIPMRYHDLKRISFLFYYDAKMEIQCYGNMYRI